MEGVLLSWVAASHEAVKTALATNLNAQLSKGPRVLAEWAVRFGPHRPQTSPALGKSACLAESCFWNGNI